MIRPQPARWFEVVAAADDAFLALESLAAAGCVEVEWHDTDRLPGATGEAAELLKEFATMSRRYRAYWPLPVRRLAAERCPPVAMLASALKAIRAWTYDADPLIKQLQDAESHARDLAVAEAALRELGDSALDFSALAQARHGVAVALFALPSGEPLDVPAPVLVRTAALQSEQLLLAVGPPAAIESIAKAVAERNGRRAQFPDWLQPTAHANLSQLAERRSTHARQMQQLRDDLDRLGDRHRLADALATVARAGWCFEHGGAIMPGDMFARVTGWTQDPQRVVQALEASDARALAIFPNAPRGARPPMMLRNPWWAQPFELFTRLVGMPGVSGADPSVLLAFAVPLMFGFMFGDVGQGLVLAAVGWLLRERLPVLRLLVPAGISAALFGLAFGSVFALETVIEPLWIHPLDQPLLLLVIPIAGGAVLLALGMLLGALEAWWDRQWVRWLTDDAPVLTTYVGLAAGLVHPLGWALAATGAAAALAGGALDGRSLRSAATALGQWLERTLQLLINTLSFARIGAFALAHAGLSSAVVALADAASHPLLFTLTLVLGNALILLIEGLVVSIQTTRLVLFEFFTRFFRAEGREFRPLAMPPVTVEEK
jgi:V/A-type H+/Na+-transporting ATPase subunit I